MKVALVYDRVNTWGGAERVLLALHKLFPDAPLYTSVYHPERSDWAKAFTIKKSFLQHLPFASRHHQLLPLFMPIAFESFSFDQYDLVISVTSESAKGILTKPGTIHICYCLTPTRYLWSGYETYFSNKVFKLFTKPAVSLLRKWDKLAAKRPDQMIAISKEVQGRIKKYYGRDSVVVYPPLTLGKNVIAGFAAQSLKGLPRRSASRNDGYFLLVSRLSKFTKYKRVDLAIEAFNELKLPLKIVGEGSWIDELREKAASNIEFVGKVTDAELVNYYQAARALVFPGVEDFGLVMIEAHNHGKPVIAFSGGGAREIVVENETGLFFNKQTKQALVAAVKKFETLRFDEKKIRKVAHRFNQKKFEKDFLAVVKQLI